MRERVIELLSFPRQIARSNMELHECHHAGHFAPDDPRCVHCQYNLECQWLYSSDEFSALVEKPMDAVLDALSFAASYVEAHVTLGGHRRPSCRCDACRWLVEAGDVLQAIDGAPGADLR